ncbi:MAG: thioredoxin-disulfide reductase [Pseudomonadota bacterium]
MIGSGPAGYTAAVYASRAALDPVMIRGLQPGGQLTITTDVENWPGEVSIMGPDLMMKMEEQAKALGTDVRDDIVTDVDLGARPYTLTLESGGTIRAKTIVIATGAQARWLGLDSEEKFRGFGVSACATCDGFFYRGKTVAVVGGGNTAVEEAMFLTNFAEKVYLIHRRDELRCDATNAARLFANKKVEPVWNATVAEVLGDTDPLGVTGVRLAGTNGAPDRELDIAGLFIAIGHDPATQLFRGKVDMDDDGYILTRPDSTATSITGVFAAGDVKDHVYRQAVTAAGMGCMAALEAERLLASEEDADAAAMPEAQAAE